MGGFWDRRLRCVPTGDTICATHVLYRFNPVPRCCSGYFKHSHAKDSSPFYDAHVPLNVKKLDALSTARGNTWGHVPNDLQVARSAQAPEGPKYKGKSRQAPDLLRSCSTYSAIGLSMSASSSRK